jgi:hypothetical protein
LNGLADAERMSRTTHQAATIEQTGTWQRPSLDTRDQLAAAERADLHAYNAAITDGWTADEVRKLGLPEPDDKKRARQRSGHTEAVTGRAAATRKLTPGQVHPPCIPGTTHLPADAAISRRRGTSTPLRRPVPNRDRGFRVQPDPDPSFRSPWMAQLSTPAYAPVRIEQDPV